VAGVAAYGQKNTKKTRGKKKKKKKGRRGGGDLEGEEGKVIPKKYYFNRVENDLDV
jgi:hypothetical protein